MDRRHERLREPLLPSGNGVPEMEIITEEEDLLKYFSNDVSNGVPTVSVSQQHMDFNNSTSTSSRSSGSYLVDSSISDESVTGDFIGSQSGILVPGTVHFHEHFESSGSSSSQPSSYSSHQYFAHTVANDNTGDGQSPPVYGIGNSCNLLRSNPSLQHLSAKNFPGILREPPQTGSKFLHSGLPIGGREGPNSPRDSDILSVSQSMVPVIGSTVDHLDLAGMHGVVSVGGSGNTSEFSSTSGEESDPLHEIEPSIDPGPHFDIGAYLGTPVQIEFTDLNDRVFEKQQSRKDKKARQRVVDGKVRVGVTSDRHVQELKVWVRRERQAAALCGDKNGEMELKKPTCLRHPHHNQWLFVADLDSIYEGKERPVYELAKVEMNERNMFELLAQVVFKNGEASDKIVSKAFLIRTLKKTFQEEAPPPPITGNKRPHTWHSPRSQTGKSPRSGPENEVDSTGSPISSATSTSESSQGNDVQHLDKVVVDHLEAQRANIQQLTFGYMLQTRRGDIAYHLRLTDQARKKELYEGVVVGFFPSSDGKTKIEPLSSENIRQAVMAGVISRSAFVEADVPAEIDKGQTDAVCVIGMVCVEVEGTVHSGERIYTSSYRPGTAIPESHLPVGAFITKQNTLLGMAMESLTPTLAGESSLVKCFVCIVLGIGSHQLSREVEQILECTEKGMKKEIRRSSRKNWKRMFCLVAVIGVFLGLFGYLLYELLAPGTEYQYWRCRRGAVPGRHTLHYLYSNDDGKHVPVNGIQFTYENLKKKLSDSRDGKVDFPPFNESISGHFRYFLNIDRCAWGGKQDGGFFKPTVEGALALVVRCPCKKPSYKWSKDQVWCYDKISRQGNFTCHPEDCGYHEQPTKSTPHPTPTLTLPGQRCIDEGRGPNRLGHS